MPCYRYRPEPMTQREMVRELHRDDPDVSESVRNNEYVPDPKLGERNNTRAKAVWDAKNDALDEPGLITMCGDFEMTLCREPGCDREGLYLCDWPMGRGKTCDLPLCPGHAREIGEDRHLCPIHHPMWTKQAGVARINPWPPRK